MKTFVCEICHSEYQAHFRRVPYCWPCQQKMRILSKQKRVSIVSPLSTEQLDALVLMANIQDARRKGSQNNEPPNTGLHLTALWRALMRRVSKIFMQYGYKAYRKYGGR